MRKLMAALAAVLAIGAGGVTVNMAAASADSVQPVGSTPIPDSPAHTWIVADLGSG